MQGSKNDALLVEDIVLLANQIYKAAYLDGFNDALFYKE